MNEPVKLLEGVRVIESSLLEPASLGMLLADLGADVIKVEPPGEGDYVRRMAWPVIDGVSILHWHCNRGKRSLTLDLRVPEAVEAYLDLVEGADVVIEGMRPGALARRGITDEAMRERNPAIVICTISGYGMTGPYADMPSHGIAFDAWAGVAPPAVDDDGFTYIADHLSVGTKTAPAWGALGVLAGLTRARATGVGSRLDVAQTDAAAYANWLRIEGERAYERPEDEVTGNPSDDYVRRPIGVAGMRDGVRYQYYPTSDGHVLFMASEREFWENFCRGIGRDDLFEANPGKQYADHALGNIELRRELTTIFAGRTTREWVVFGSEVNTPIAPVNSATSIGDDPQFSERFPWLPAADYGTDLMPVPINLVEETRAPTRRAPEVGEHNDEILAELYDEERRTSLRASGALG